MNKKEYKAWLITAIIVVMFVTILTMLFLLNAKIIFFVIMGILAAGGLGCGAIFLHSWIAGWDEDELDPVEIKEESEPKDDPADVPIDTITYDQIRAEFGGGA